jgi:3'-phosphoadenosine 5'-phosphosulfate sulfotransferase (PAPS reductase)/FAD synthetase
MSDTERFTVEEINPENEIRHNGAPDRFVLCSGGVNSVAMAYKMLEDVWTDDYSAWNKRPVVIYADTTIGLSSQRLYVELLAREYNWQLWKCQTQQPFEEYSEDKGFHGNQGHNGIFNVLKGRQFQTLATKSANPHLYFGSLIEEKGDHVERVDWRDDLGAYTHNPILYWSEQDCVDYLRDRGVPYNPNWEASHFTDCGCGATASREELIELEAEGYEIFAQKLRDLEERVETEDKRETWAWGSFSPDEQQWMDAENDGEQMQLSELACGDTCSGSCLSPTATEGGRSVDTDSDRSGGGA